MTYPSPVLSVREACSALRIGKTTLYTLINSQQLRVVKIGRATRITSESIRLLLNGAPQPSAPAN